MPDDTGKPHYEVPPDLQMRIRVENIKRLQAFAKLPPHQRLAKKPPARVFDYKPVALATKLQELST